MKTPATKNYTAIKAKAIVIILVASMFGTYAPTPAHAQATAAACAVGGYLSAKIAGALNSIGLEVPVNPTALTAKGFTLDKLASCAAKELLHQMTLSTINWINSGFNGSPSFLTDPKGFFLDAADQVTGEFLSDNGPLNNLCSPWSVDIRLAIAFGQSSFDTSNRRYTCTLGRIINNAQNTSFSIDGFVQGDFSQGGWPAYISMISEPQNNPYGAYLSAHSNLLAAVGEKQGGLSKALLEGNGFLSWKSCKSVPVSTVGGVSSGTLYDDANGGVAPSGNTTVCTTQTPGSVIAHALNTHADTGVVEAELANDINSVVNALITQLTSQMLSKGLHSLTSGGSGVSGSGYSSTDSYVQQLQQDTTYGKISGTYSNAVNVLTAGKADYTNAISCFNTKIAAAKSANPSASTTPVITMQNYIANINSTIASTVDPVLNAMNAKLALVQAGSTSITNTTAQSDLTYAQSQAQLFSSDAATYQNICNTLP